MFTITISQNRNGQMSYKNGTMDEMKRFYAALLKTYRTRRELDTRKIRHGFQLVKILNAASDFTGKYWGTFALA